MSDLFQDSTSAVVTAVPRLDVVDTPHDHHISLEEGVALTRRHRTLHPNAIHASMFDRAIIDEILSQENCAGLRMYYGAEPDGAPTLVIVGVDSNGNDLFEATLAEDHYPCPPFCNLGGGDLNR